MSYWDQRSAKASTPTRIRVAADQCIAGRKSFVITLAVYCVLVFVASWLGGVLPSLLRLTHTRLQLLISLIGGLMLGVGLLHQLPHAVAALADAGVPAPLDRGMLCMLLGLTAMFF